MANLIYQPPIPIPGMVGIFPQQKFAIFGDNLATVTTAGYLNSANLELNPLSTNDIIQSFYNYNLQTQVGVPASFTVSISNSGVITLVVSDTGVINSGTANQLAYYAAAGNSISGIGPLTNGQLLIGSSGVAPVAASITSGNAVSITNASGSITVAYAPARVNGTEASNAVTVNGQVGVITTSSLTTAAGSSYAITWTNSYISSTSCIQLTLMGGTSTVESVVFKAVVGSGSCTLTIYNIGSSSALNGTLLIGFLVI